MRILMPVDGSEYSKSSVAFGRCCINPVLDELPQTPAVAMPRLPSEDGQVL